MDKCLHFRTWNLTMYIDLTSLQGPDVTSKQLVSGKAENIEWSQLKDSSFIFATKGRINLPHTDFKSEFMAKLTNEKLFCQLHEHEK